MPAVGKSTVGRLLARRLGLNFVDTDDLIETGEQKTLARIIRDDGMTSFLDTEAGHIKRLACRNHVIATGGSVVYRNNAMTHLAGISTILYLRVSLDTLLNRMGDPEKRGVAIGPGKSIQDLYKERTPLYDTWSDLKIDCGEMSADQVAQKALMYFK